MTKRNGLFLFILIILLMGFIVYFSIRNHQLNKQLEEYYTVNEYTPVNITNKKIIADVWSGEAKAFIIEGEYANGDKLYVIEIYVSPEDYIHYNIGDTFFIGGKS